MSVDKTAENQFGYVKDDKVYRNAFLDQPEMEIGVVRESPEKSLEYFEERFKNFESKITELEESIGNATNKGSYLMKLVHLKGKLMTYNGLGDFEGLVAKIEVLKFDLDKSINENRVRNLELKKTFLEELKKIIDCPEEKLIETVEEVKENKNKWLRTGSVTDEEKDNMEKQYSELLDKFFARKKEYQAKQKEELKKVTIFYHKLIGKVGTLRSLRNDDRFHESLQEISKEWKSLPPLPERVNLALQRKLEKRIKDVSIQRKRRGQAPRGPRQGGGYGQQRSEPFAPEMLKLKEELLNQAMGLKDMELNSAVDAAKLLQEKWLSSGRSMAPEIKTIYNKFREIIASIFEKKTLEINLLKKFPDFAGKADSEKKILQISIMRDLIRKAKSDAKLLQENLDLASSSPGSPDEKTLLTKVKNQKFRIRIRENLLNEIEMS